MRLLRTLCALSAAFCIAHAPEAWAVKEKTPPDLAAKRSGKVSQATPSPLNMIYTPVAPCRAFAGQSLTANQTKNFKLTGNGSFASQGGPASGCGVPAYAKAVSIALTAPSSSANAYVTAFAAGSTKPNPSLVVPTTGSYGVTSTIVQLSSTGLMSVHATKPTIVYGDVTGYFEPQLEAYVGSNAAVIDSSGRITSATKSGTGAYVITFDRNVDTCSATASADFTAHMTSAYTSGSSVYIYMYGATGAPEDYWFNVHVKC